MRMKLYIHASACISPQDTFAKSSLDTNLISYTNDNILFCKEPDYEAYIPPAPLRRMSKLLRMGLTTAIECLNQGGNPMLKGIITGTGKGSMEDTEKFLHDIRDFKEEALTPTPFIQSTYNSVNGLIALQNKNILYSNTFVHRAFSLESAIIDGAMQAKQNPTAHYLVGSFEEITKEHFTIKNNIDFWKKEKIESLELFKHNTPGTISGEGTAFFLTSNTKSKENETFIKGIELIYKPKLEEIKIKLDSFLKELNLNINDIDLLISGRSGDNRHDHFYNEMEILFKNEISILNFKHMCGEHDTAIGFALWLTNSILVNQAIPKGLGQLKSIPAKIKNILIYNNYFSDNHTFLLLSNEEN